MVRGLRSNVDHLGESSISLAIRMKTHSSRGWRWLIQLLGLIAVADWLALKTRAFSHPPWILAVLAGTMMVLLLLRFGGVLRECWLGRRQWGQSGGHLVFLGGIFLAVGGGLVNWAFGLQGFVLLHQGEAVPLHGGSHLHEFERGPLSRIWEMERVLMLVELELVPVTDGSFYPRSRLVLSRLGDESIEVEVSSRRSAAAGSLRLYQGAFGFAPHIVITEEGNTIFDRVVPFTTERRGPSGICFEGHFRLESEDLDVRGVLDLTSLDEGMRGHATLGLLVTHSGRRLGHGSLLPGHFAELSEGYRIGFVGLEKWSEIDISRRDYSRVIVVGTALSLLGAIFWPLARWRGW